jgi:type III secretion protein K
VNGATPAPGLARLIGVQPDLVRTLCLFNQNPADYIDASRRDEFFTHFADGVLWQSERARRHLSRHILERLGDEPCLDAQRPEWAVALLDRPRLDRLGRHLAAALVGPRVRRCVSRAEVLAWREWLSPEAHEFALTRAGLLPVSADAGDEPRQMPAEALGRQWIVAAARAWHEAIRRRFMLKLPAGAFREADAIDPALAARLVSSVLSIVEPRWCSSFATIRI